MGAVAIQLGALVLVPGVLDRELMQPELLGDHREVLGAGGAQVQPDHRVGIAAHFARWLTAHVWETRLTAEGVTLTPAQYVLLRRQSVGLDHSYDIAEWTYDFELPLRVAARTVHSQDWTQRSG